jgi:5-(carboxyamino)imidazole ribonucleotide mutase
VTDTAAPDQPLVSIIMGSDSDWPTMRAAADLLAELGIPFEADVVSAHRTPDKMTRFARGAAARGIRVVIAGAGGAAHLPGMVASMTTLPVIGVPVQLARLDGLDSLLSIVQMPAGIPVATMAINGAANAGLLAARIIGSADPAVASRLQEYAEGLEQLVEEKAARLRESL